MDGPVGLLEARVEPARGVDVGAAMVICHPHPLHGGTLDNKVVHTLARAARDAGLRAIRFNFRGVGASAGVHDDGRGEVDDLLAIVDACRLQSPGRELVLAGFSFGAWVAAAGALRLAGVGVPPVALLLVAPPVQYPGFELLDHFPVPVCVVQGDDDDVVDPDDVAAWCGSRHPSIACTRMPTGHFFHGALPALKDDVAGWLAAALPSQRFLRSATTSKLPAP